MFYFNIRKNGDCTQNKTQNMLGKKCNEENKFHPSEMDSCSLKWLSGK